MNSFPIWARSLGQNPVRKLEPPTSYLAATEMRPAFRAREAIASKASTPLTNTTSQESRRDPNTGRGGQRYKLALRVQLNDGTGITRDISKSGIFFETESAYSIGDRIRLSLNFEQETLQCEARVVRVEPRNGQFGVAVELTSYVSC
jgi:hypothetical protein